jgi:hypothetical protein
MWRSERLLIVIAIEGNSLKTEGTRQDSMIVLI